MRFSLAAANAILLASASQAQDFMWNCNPKARQTCNNACFAIDHGLAPDVLTKAVTMDDTNRRLSGCKARPCNARKAVTRRFRRYGNSCDEFPFASTQEGGTGAILRCVLPSDNASQGSQLGHFYRGLPDGHQYEIILQGFQGVPLCANPGSRNDGYEFYYVRSAKPKDRWRKVPRDENGEDHEVEDEEELEEDFDFGTFQTAQHNTTITSHAQREYYESEHGDLLLRITRGYGKTLTGRHIYDEYHRPVRVGRRVSHDEAEHRIVNKLK